MAKFNHNGAVFLLNSVLFLLGLRNLEFCSALTVRFCEVGEGRGFTCPDATADIQCQSNSYCTWRYGRSESESGKVGPSLNLNETSKFGEYYLVDTRRDVIEGLVFVMPKGKANCIAAINCSSCMYTLLSFALNCRYNYPH